MKGAAVEFDGEVGPDGKIGVPPAILAKIGRGRRVRVRLTGAALSSALARIGVTADEVDRIAGLQREAEEQVIAFLLSEGRLARRGKGRHRTSGRAGKR
ncbi:MAG TPA: hypothetical protein VL221_03655 [Bacteroidota bacterium]|nr:hypothetical protein [Bacteroidota bacterium]